MNTPSKNKGNIIVSLNNKVAQIMFGHPNGNSFPTQLLKDLEAQIIKLTENESVGCIILKSEGTGVFCAGASFDELIEISDIKQGTMFFSGFANVINAIRKCTKPVIARVQGRAVGGGVGLIAACDYVFATSKSEIKLSEIAIGIGPFVIEPAVSRKIGSMSTSALTLAPLEWKSASWALNKGLFNEVFENIEDLDHKINIFTQEIASYHSEAIIEYKKILWQGTDNWDDLLKERAAISGRLVLSDFTKKAISEFKIKK